MFVSKQFVQSDRIIHITEWVCTWKSFIYDIEWNPEGYSMRVQYSISCGENLDDFLLPNIEREWESEWEKMSAVRWSIECNRTLFIFLVNLIQQTQ